MVEMDKLIIWVSAGTITGLISLMIFVSMRSNPKEVELFRPEMTLSTSSGCTGLSVKEQVLPAMRDLSFERGLKQVQEDSA